MTELKEIRELKEAKQEVFEKLYERKEEQGQ